MMFSGSNPSFKAVNWKTKNPFRVSYHHPCSHSYRAELRVDAAVLFLSYLLYGVLRPWLRA